VVRSTWFHMAKVKTGVPQNRSKAYHTRNHKPTGVTHAALVANLKHDSKPTIEVNDFLEVYCALHFASLVPGPIQDASGMMLVAPSGGMKSSLLMILSTLYPESCICDSNWYYGKLIKMRSAFYNGGKRSIVIPELASLYAGDPRTGGRMEQMLQQLAGEGSITTQEADSRWERYEMRAQVFAAMTPEFARKKNRDWEEGFHRRFLWAHLAMQNDEVLLDYLTAWKRAEIEVSQPIIEPAQKTIPDLLNYGDKMKIRKMLEAQKDFGPNHTRFVFLCRALSVLKWHYRRIGSKKIAMETLKRFSVCLSDHAALLVIPEEPTAVKYRRNEERKQIATQSK
jgi:hypothetical protein